MKKLFLSIIFFNLLTISSLSHVEHYKKFDVLEYELFRNNKSIGYHKYNFERKKELLKVKSIVEFKIIEVFANANITFNYIRGYFLPFFINEHELV